MSAKHTPGPWSINECPQANASDIAIGAIGTPLIARVLIRDVSINEQRANAIIISASPDLLASAKQALAVFKAGPWAFPKGPLDIAIKALEAAISKAEEMA